MSQPEDEVQLELEEARAEARRYKSERDAFHTEIIELKLAVLRKDVDDHEVRVRQLETTATRSNVLFALATGGGAIGIIALIRTISLIP